MQQAAFITFFIQNVPESSREVHVFVCFEEISSTNMRVHFHPTPQMLVWGVVLVPKEAGRFDYILARSTGDGYVFSFLCDS